MNPLLSPSKSSFLPLNQLTPHCNRLRNSLNEGRSNQKKVLLEQTLWNEVKKIRALNDTSIFLYLLGYYHSILYQVAHASSQSDLFRYNVLIRLGDLNRYINRCDVAEYYYCNARNSFPLFGHAYNQLGLLVKPTNCYKCCYFYARAAKSSEKPLNTIADSNLRIAVSKFDCKLLSHIINDDNSLGDNGQIDGVKMPKSAFDWFYIIIVAIYADNINPIAKLFLTFFNENFSIQTSTIIRDNVKMITVDCDQESYILIACLDILLDWLRLGSQGKTVCPNIVGEARQIRSCLQSVLNSCRLELSQHSTNNSQDGDAMGSSNFSSNEVSLSNSNSILIDSTSTSLQDSSKDSSKISALPHDYVLRGFGPLDRVHQDLVFETSYLNSGLGDESSLTSNSKHRFIDTTQLMSIALRIKTKINAFGILARKQTRNIALESILSNMERDAYS